MTPGLIERLEVAGEGSRELDWRIADLTGHPSFERKVEGLWPPFAERSRSDNAIPAYTTSLDAALALAERVLDSKSALHLLADLLSYEAAQSDFDLIKTDDLPRLLCIAILKARATQDAETLSRTKANSGEAT